VRVVRLTGTASRVVERPLPVDDPRRRKPDITRARDLLGWSPAVALEDGLEATIAWFANEIAPDVAIRLERLKDDIFAAE
jgi:UDP-glucuronate decarboxylase